MTMQNSEAAVNVARRDFLKTGGALVVTFSLGTSDASLAAEGAPAKTVAADQVDGFLAIDAKGNVTVYSGKVDLGTGIRTAMTQIAAEELSVPLDRVTVIQGDTLLTPDQGITFGSLSIQNGGMQIRQAAATARQALLTEGAMKLGLDKDAVVVKDGVVGPKAGGKGVAYAALVGGKDFRIAVDAKAPTKDPKDYTIVGKPVARLDIPDKVTGRFTYMQDFRRKGMLHARVIRPAGMKATLLSWNDFDCRKTPGYVGVVKKGNFLAVLARSEWGAIAASRTIETKWSDWAGLPDQAKLWEVVRTTKVAKDEDLQKVGDAGEALKTPNAKIVSATYDFAIHTHGSIGPSCAVAEFVDGKLTVWSASQQTHLLRKQIALMLGLKPDDVRCVYIEGSGCYGRNGHEDAAADAALIAKETGMPVRVQWMREEEHGWDPKGPPTLHDFKAAIDAQGNVVGWQSEVFIPDRPKDIVGRAVAGRARGPADRAVASRATSSSRSRFRTRSRTSARSRTGSPRRRSDRRGSARRGACRTRTATRCFIDEVVVATGADPLEFRLQEPEGPARCRALAGTRRACQLEAAQGARGGQRQRRAGTRPRLRQVRARAHLRGRGGRCRSRPCRPARSA